MSELAALSGQLSMDVKDFVSPILEAKAKVEEMAQSATESMRKAASSIDSATASMKKQADTSSVSSKAAKDASESSVRLGDVMSSAFWIALKPASALLGVVSMFVPKLKMWALGLATVSGLHGALAGYSTATAKANQREAESVEQLTKARNAEAAATERMNAAAQGSTGKSSSVTQNLSDMSSLVGLTANVAAGYVLYKSGIDEVVTASAKHLSINSDMMKGLTGLAGTAGTIAKTAMDTLSTGIKASAVALLTATTGFESLTDVVDYGASAVTSFAGVAQTGMDYVKSAVKDLGLTVSATLASTRSFFTGEIFNSEAFRKEGQLLNELAEETERTGKKQAEYASIMDTLKNVSAMAANDRVLELDKVRIAQLKTEDAINAEMQALRLRQRTLHDNNETTKASKKYAEDYAKALEAQRTAILKGDLTPQKEEKPKEESEKESPAAAKYRQLTEELNKVTLGEAAAARAAIASSAATDEEVAALMRLQEQVVAATDAKKKQEEQDKLAKQGADRITKLKDEIDLLNKSATKAEIAMREMSRQGFSKEQIDEVGKLEAELERLNALEKNKEKTDKEKTDNADSKAAEQGSSETAKIFLRGIGGGKDDTKNAVEKGNKHLQKIEEKLGKSVVLNIPTFLGSNLLGMGP
jgi:hypothetical protein